ncbi:hypothetical protein FOZ60_000284 [Perkinsus olseni]|uniref:Uncharacterized protein n=1 Tax=Perkinsus olseni TaxID=32597 RepID=A0A7J6N1E6_PEROL|nr:hypothetical protein FOZ60_000284 [Perkinsus olseni]
MESFHCNGCNSQRMFESLRWKLHNDMVEALQNTTQCYCRAAQKSPTCPFCKHCQDDYWSYEHYATLTDILGFYACQPNDRMDETKMVGLELQERCWLSRGSSVPGHKTVSLLCWS